jgi:hypothetical protein
MIHSHVCGRKHPDDPDLTFNGHSIGHWEGDTLVVDTVGEDATHLTVRLDHDGDLAGREQKLHRIRLIHDLRHAGRQAIRRLVVLIAAFGLLRLVRLHFGGIFRRERRRFRRRTAAREHELPYA